MKNKNTIKNIIIIVLSIVILITLAGLINLKRAFSLREYAIANDCEWTWQGTYYGDDRDYICK